MVLRPSLSEHFSAFVRQVMRIMLRVIPAVNLIVRVVMRSSMVVATVVWIDS